MFDIVYPYRFIQFNHVNDGMHLRTHKYCFKANNNQRYIVEFDQFEGDLLLVKFYQKRHSKSPHKYNLLSNSGWACSVIYTTLNLMLDILKEGGVNNPSFAFMGSYTIYPDGKQESKANTKRFSFYKRLIANFVGSETFEFKQNVASSIFVLLNRKSENVNNSLGQILEYIYANYNILDIDLILEPYELTPQSG